MKIQTSNSDNKSAHHQVLWLIQEGMLQKNAFDVVSGKTGQAALAIKTYFHQYVGSNSSAHGNSALTAEEESQLTSMLIVFSLIHQAISIKSIQEYVSKLFSQMWVNFGQASF